MKQFLFVTLGLLAAFSAQSQEIAGQWFGSLTVQGVQMRLVFNITQSASGYSATLDSPDQGAKGIPVSSTTYNKPVLKLSADALQLTYTGELKGDSIIGTFRQGGFSLPMNLGRKEVEKKAVSRPQEPSKPYPYRSEDVHFENAKAGVTLAGTLTLPGEEGVFPAVILISGSGPQNRDEELMGHKPFLVLSDYLTRNGIAVLRYDDRGTAGSTGDFKTATSLDFATDVEAALSFLHSRKEINRQKIGLVGHSEGGLIAPLIAQKSGDVSYVVLLAAPGLRGDELLLMQTELIGKSSGVSDAELQKAKELNKKAFAIVTGTPQPDAAKEALAGYFKSNLQGRPAGMSEEAYVKAQVDQLTSPWLTFFLRHDPAPVLEQVRCPVLALNGEMDLQVPAGANLEAIRKALEKGGNRNVTARALPGLNHLFQECKTGSPNEYATIEQTFSPAALSAVTTWIQQQTK
ncbi:alpha/beta fold hydrolase [Ravibacter arvi]|uniref:Alpha/beta fold hydrolase n=1 Tax=Ravibacter arvi TaxID=2051041 RepID=A0ABP8LUE9_9BACT